MPDLSGLTAAGRYRIDELIEWLKTRGYEPVRIDELLTEMKRTLLI